jgi:hypothetical protein
VLADAGWLFDDFVNNEMRRVLTSDPDGSRDRRPSPSSRPGWPRSPLWRRYA